MQTTTHARKEFLGNGVTVAFAFDFQLGDAAEVQVWVDGVQKTTPTDYSVTLTGTSPDFTGGTVTFVVAPPAPAVAGVPNVILLRVTPSTQPTDLPSSGAVDLDGLERRLDAMVRKIQEQDEALARAVAYGRAAPTTSVVLPTTLVANRYLRTKADGSGWDLVEPFAGAAVNPMSVRRSAIRGGVGGAMEAVPVVAAGRILTDDGTDVVYGQGPLTTTGDLLVGATAGTPTRLAAGAAGTVLRGQGAGTDPAYGAVQSADLTAFLRSALHGRCRLTKSGATLLLSPQDGNTLVINSAIEQIPDAGVTLAATGLVANTTYYLYAYMAAGVMTLEASTTAPAVQAGTGIKIKTGDATRTLVGMARVVTGPAWVDTATQRFVLSYFTRRGLSGLNSFAANRSTAATAYAELSNTERVEFLTWSDEAVVVSITGGFFTSVAADRAQTSIGIDGTTPEDAMSTEAPSVINRATALAATSQRALAEGYHFATVLGKNATAANTITWFGSGTAGERITLLVGIRG